MSDDLEFLDSPATGDNQQPQEAQITVEAVAPAAVEPLEAKPDIPPGHVPYAAMLDERDKRKERDRELKELREELERERQARQQPPKIPDPLDDASGFADYQRQQAESLALNVKLDVSEDMARDKFGDEKVDAARDWALAKYRDDPSFRSKVITQRNPYGFVVQQFEREQALGKIDPKDIDDYLAWKSGQQTQQQQSALAAPRSLASMPSAGGSKPGKADLSSDAVFAEVFKG